MWGGVIPQMIIEEVLVKGLKEILNDPREKVFRCATAGLWPVPLRKMLSFSHYGGLLRTSWKLKSISTRLKSGL